MSVAALALAGAPASAPAAATADKYDVDPVHSFVFFKIKHLGVGYVWGRINGPTGAILLDEATPSGSSVSVDLKADNVDTGVEKRDQHLKSPDFFNAKQFPTISFKSKSVKKSGDSGFEVTGDFTLLGVSKEITITLNHVGTGKDPMGNIRTGFDGSLTVKRSDYGMKQMLDMASDDVLITLSIEGTRK